MNNISGLINGFPTPTSLPAPDSKSGGEAPAPSRDSHRDSFANMLAGLSRPSADETGSTAAGADAGPRNGFSEERFSLKTANEALSESNAPAAETPDSEPAAPQLGLQTLKTFGLAGAATPRLQNQPPANAALIEAKPQTLPSGKAGGQIGVPAVTRPTPPPAATTAAAPQTTPPARTPQSQVPNTTPGGTAAAVLRKATTVEANAAALLAADAPAAAEPGDPVPPATAGRRSAHGQSSSTSESTVAQHRRQDAAAQPSQATPNVDPQTIVPMVTSVPPPIAPPAPASQSPTQRMPGSLAQIDDGLTGGTLAGRGRSHDAAQDSDASVKVNVVAQATHFAPPASLSPVQQVVDAIAPAFAPRASAGTQSDSAAASSTVVSSTSLDTLLAAAQPSAPPVKTLDLQLDPQTLGTVSIKLNLSADGLSVEVQASQSTTVDLLQKDKQLLTQGLSGAGYTVSGIDIGLAPANHAAAGFADQGAAQNSSAQLSGGGTQGNGGSPTQDGGAHDSPSRQQHRQGATEPSQMARSAPQRSPGSGLYI